MATAEELIETLGLRPHPEGGWYAETWRAPDRVNRPASTGIYYLLQAGERSHWHTVDADEIWCHHTGAPLRLRLSQDGSAADEHLLGSDIAAGQRPQVVVPAGWWQSAEPAGEWTLVTCVVAPGFTFEGFTMAPAGWEPA